MTRTLSAQYYNIPFLFMLNYHFIILSSPLTLYVIIILYRGRRAAKEAKEAPAQPAPEKARVDIKKFVKIGRPGYKGIIQFSLTSSILIGKMFSVCFFCLFFLHE